MVTAMKEKSETPLSEQTAAKPADEQVLVYRASDLFQGSRKIIISYGDSNYELRITKNGKLILTK